MNWKLPALAVLSGVLLSLPWLGFSGLFLLLAFIPVLYLNHFFVERKQAYMPIVFWGYSFLSMLVWNVITTWWIAHATPAGAAFAILTNSFVMSIVWLLVHYASRNNNAGFSGLFFLFIWISFEYMHYHWELAWPWLNLGNGLANEIRLIQWYEYTGVFGGTLWILLSNLLLWNLVKRKWLLKTFVYKTHFVAVALVLVLPVLLSLIRFETYHEKDDPVSAVVLQPNINPYTDKFDEMPQWQQHERLLNLAKQYNNMQVDLFVGPETALHNIWQNRLDKEPIIKSIWSFLEIDHPKAAFITGAMSYRLYNNKNEASSTARYMDDGIALYDAFNTAIFLIPSNKAQLYHKSKLVSGVEKMPFKRYLHFMEKFIVDLGGTTGTLATQNEAVVFENNKTIVGVPICYESVFGGHNRQFVLKGANLLVVITNDGWWRNTPGYKQHLSYSRIQAIQFRRSVLRSANTGISAIINQKGEIEQQTPWWIETSLWGNVNRNSELSFYVRQGDYIARAALFMFLLMLLGLLVELVKNKKPHYPD